MIIYKLKSNVSLQHLENSLKMVEVRRFINVWVRRKVEVDARIEARLWIMENVIYIDDIIIKPRNFKFLDFVDDIFLFWAVFLL